MADITLRTARSTFENALIDVLQYAYAVRLTPAADVAALRLLASTGIDDRSMRYVTSKGRAYQWLRASLSADDGDIYVQPADVASGKPGRWIKTASAVQAGYAKRCELFNDNSADIDTFEQRIFGRMPALLISFDRAEHEPKSTEPGALYWCRYHFSLFAVSLSGRGKQTSRQGSPVAAEAVIDPGTAAMIGDAKAAFAGLTGEDLGLPDIAYVQIGDEQPVVQDQARDRYVETLEVVVYATLTNPDTVNIVQLADPYEFNVQLRQADIPSSGQYDASNLVQSDGLRFALGNGLTQSFAGGAVAVNGQAVTVVGAAHAFSADKVTYRDLAVDGTLTYVETNVGDEAPAVAYGMLRLGVTVTDGSGVRLDRLLASTIVDFGPSNKDNAPLLTSIAISPLSATIPHGTPIQFTATGTFEDSSTQDITFLVTWSSSNQSAATFADRTGIATTPNAGTSTIGATLAGISAPTATLTVT